MDFIRWTLCPATAARNPAHTVARFQNLKTRPTALKMESLLTACSRARLYRQRPTRPSSSLSAFQDMLTTGLLRMDGDMADLALAMFTEVSKFISEAEDAERQILAFSASQIMERCMNFPALKDELYMQLKKHSKANINLQSKIRVWELWLALAAAAPPSKVRHSRTRFCTSRILRITNCRCVISFKQSQPTRPNMRQCVLSLSVSPTR